VVHPPLPAAVAEEVHPQTEEVAVADDVVREHYQTPTQALPEVAEAAPAPAVPAPVAPAPVKQEAPPLAQPDAESLAKETPEVGVAPASAPVVAFVPPVLAQEKPAEPVPVIEAVSQASVPLVAEPHAPTEAAVVAIAEEAPPEPAAEAPGDPVALNPDELQALPVVSPAVLLDSLPLPPVMAEALAAIDPEQSEHDVLYALPDSPEPSYSSVAKHIEHTLLGLLDDLSLPERHRPQAEAMRDRLQNGLNWYELLPILDDLAVLMLAITDSGQHEFETYLKQLNERLEAFQSNLQAASDGHADSSSAARAMDTQIREQVDGLQSSVQEAADLDDLKQVLESHLEGLLGTMDHHQKQRDEREREVAPACKAWRSGSRAWSRRPRATVNTSKNNGRRR